MTSSTFRLATSGFTRRRLVSLLACVALVWCVGAVTAPPASANARTGVCAKGWRLGSYTYTQPAYNSAGEKMYSITWSKRWCYNTSKKQVGTTYDPAPSVRIYSYFTTAWKNGGIAARDARYTSRDARGQNHPKQPKWAHMSTYTVNMRHCTFPVVKGVQLCFNNYVTGGIIGYWDGSKKLVF